jgi:hypothetical protein
VDHDRLALPHPGDVGPAAGRRDQPLVVGVRGTDDGHRQAAAAVRLDEEVLAGDLVPRVLPERIAQRRRLGDRKPAGRLLIRGCRADEDVLPGASLEDVEILLDLIRGEGEEFGDDVILRAGHRLAHCCRIPDVGDELADAFWKSPAGGAAVEDGHLVSLLDRSPHAGCADRAGAADVQDASCRHPTRLARARLS